MAIRPESENTSYCNVRESLDRFPAGKGLAGLSPRIIDRFLQKIAVRSADECWLWTAGKFRHGYGMFGAGRDRFGTCDVRYAHRLAFQLATGVDPGGLVVMHKCDVPACCNPAHLQLGTQGDNVRDCFAKGRQSKHKAPRKLAAADVAAIRASGEKNVRLAEQYGVSRALIGLIRRGLRRAA